MPHPSFKPGKLNGGIVSPAYGRDYTKSGDAINAFLAGKDFKHEPSGSYCSVRDFEPGALVEICYAKLAKSVALYVP